MKNNKTLKTILLPIILVLIAVVSYMEILPLVKISMIKNTVYTDMKDKSEEVMKGVIGIVPERSTKNGIASAAIIKKDGNIYLAVTAKHNVDDKTNKYKIFIKDNNELIDANVEYTSLTNQMAFISFEYDGDLTVLDIENKTVKKGDRIMVISAQEDKNYTTTYGRLKSNIKKMKLKRPDGIMMNDRFMKHDAYINKDNVNGIVFNENNHMVGINVYGSYTLLGTYEHGYMIPADEVKMEYNRIKVTNSDVVKKD